MQMKRPLEHLALPRPSAVVVGRAQLGRDTGGSLHDTPDAVKNDGGELPLWPEPRGSIAASRTNGIGGERPIRLELNMAGATNRPSPGVEGAQASRAVGEIAPNRGGAVDALIEQSNLTMDRRRRPVGGSARKTIVGRLAIVVGRRRFASEEGAVVEAACVNNCART
jgi:hypothetical protein